MLDSQNISVLMYADDIVLLSESPIGLQNCINNLLEYCSQWKLSLNLKKTKVVIFNTNLNSLAICRNNDFYFDNNKIEQVRSYEYLGIIFQENGDFSLAIKNLYSKSLKAYFSLRRHFNNNVFTNPKTQCILFNSCISPILQYGSEVWGAFITSKKPDANIFKQNMFKDTNIMEKLHIRFCKQILGIHSKSSNHVCRAELW